MKIILDNGHGKNTLGKKSPDGQLLEWKYTREIVDGIYTKLTEYGYDVIKLVPEETDIPLSTRVKRANKIYNEDKQSFLISIHCNALGDDTVWTSARGWEIWTSIGETESDIIAKYIFKAAETELTGMKMRRDNVYECDKERDFYILKHTKCPAVLTENLFQNNKQDKEFLLSDKGRQSIINLHVNGIIDYIKENRSC